MMKKKSGKRFLSWLLAVVMIIALMPATAFAEPPTESSGNTETAVTAYCPSSEGGTDVSVGGYDSSPAAETKDTPTAEPAKDTPTAEPVKDTPTEEPVKDTPTEEPVKESPVADKTTEGAPAQEGAVENSTDEKITKDLTNEVSAAELAGLTAMLGAPVPMEIYAWQSYPVYVYGCFKHNDNYLAENAALYINGKEKAIEWNGDASKGEYYITFGKLTDATTEKPSRYQRYNYNEVPKWEINTNDIETRIAKGEVTLASKDIAGSAEKNGLATTGADVNKYVKGKWSGLKPRKGAEGFPETGTKWSWHIDGTINVYRVYYKSDDIGEPVKLPKESTYFLDDYTVRKMETSSQNYKFLGWEYKGRVYQDKETIEAPGEDITLTAKWAPKEKVYTVNYNWGSNAPEGVTLPTDNTPYNSEIEAKNAMDTTYVNGYEHKTTDGTYTFSGWTPSVGTTDYNGDKIVTPITFTGTWNFTPKPVTTYKVVYEWGSEHPSDVTLPTDSTSYDSESEAKGAMDTKYTNSSTSNAQKDGKEGLWKFSGWTASDPVASTTEENTEVITFTGSWTFTEKVVNVTYDWGNDVPSDVVSRKPADKTYNSVDAAKADMDKTFTSTSTFNAQKDGKEGLWTFSGWTPSEPVESNEGNTVSIKFTGTWTFAEKVVNVTYDWGNDVPSDVVSRKPADKTYNSVDAAKADMDKTFTSTSTFNAQKDGKEGLWTFSGWTPSEPVESNEGNTVSIKFTGTWTFAEKVVNVTYNWGTPAPSDKTCPTDGTYNTEEAARNNMDTSFTNASISNAPNGSIAGSWTFSGWTETKTTSDDGNTVLIALTGSWNFTPSEIKTITGVLNGLVQKDFKAQYNYSTEGTFTATAEVMVMPRPEAISYTAEGDVPSDNNTNTPGTDNAKTFTGTVTLKTGETKAFDFSAKDKMADVLTPNTRYTVRVSEDKGDLSKVTYDTTKYILGFETDGNAVVDYIWIAKEKDSENDHPELEPVEGTTITFHNIYTYKRHHSSSDGGNGGGKKEEKPTVEIKDDDALGLNNTDHFAYIVGYGNGEVRPQNSITRAEVAQMFYRLLRDRNVAITKTFGDVKENAWYAKAVGVLASSGIINGTSETTFEPERAITRAEFTAICTRFAKASSGSVSFTDVPETHWAYSSISTAVSYGWILGDGTGKFNPDAKITRTEAAAIVNRVLGRLGDSAAIKAGVGKRFPDVRESFWGLIDVVEATTNHGYRFDASRQNEIWTQL